MLHLLLPVPLLPETKWSFGWNTWACTAQCVPEGGQPCRSLTLFLRVTNQFCLIWPPLAPTVIPHLSVEQIFFCCCQHNALQIFPTGPDKTIMLANRGGRQICWLTKINLNQIMLFHPATTTKILPWTQPCRLSGTNTKWPGAGNPTEKVLWPHFRLKTLVWEMLSSLEEKRRKKKNLLIVDWSEALLRKMKAQSFL